MRSASNSVVAVGSASGKLDGHTPAIRRLTALSKHVLWSDAFCPARWNGVDDDKRQGRGVLLRVTRWTHALHNPRVTLVISDHCCP